MAMRDISLVYRPMAPLLGSIDKRHLHKADALAIPRVSEQQATVVSFNQCRIRELPRSRLERTKIREVFAIAAHGQVQRSTSSRCVIVDQHNPVIAKSYGVNARIWVRQVERSGIAPTHAIVVRVSDTNPANLRS